MTTPRPAIDHAVKALFRAITASARGDRLTVVDARSELLALAVASRDFEQRLITAAVDQLVEWDTLPNTTRDELTRAIEIESRRRVGGAILLAQLECLRHA